MMVSVLPEFDDLVEKVRKVVMMLSSSRGDFNIGERLLQIKIYLLETLP